MILTVILYLLILLVTIYFVIISRSVNGPTPNNKAHSTTFIIPFKNEANRIQPLIDSINQAKWPDKSEFIFVDDHSTDDTINIILNSLDIPFRLLKLRETSGKKNAIVYGVQNATHEHVHTLDADVYFEKKHLVNICKLPTSDLTVLPVQLTGLALFQQLNAIEFQWLQTITFSFAKLKRPTLCNGANLSFCKSTFLESLETRTDFDQPSGDDIYLLEWVKTNGGRINAFNNVELSIKTDAPTRVSTLVSQRKRWIKKVLNGPAIVLILLFILYNVTPILALLKSSENSIWLLPVILKILAEFVLSNEFTIKQFILIILHQFYYPIYGFILLISLPFKGNWK